MYRSRVIFHRALHPTGILQHSSEQQPDSKSDQYRLDNKSSNHYVLGADAWLQIFWAMADVVNDQGSGWPAERYQNVRQKLHCSLPS